MLKKTGIAAVLCCVFALGCVCGTARACGCPSSQNAMAGSSSLSPQPGASSSAGAWVFPNAVGWTPTLEAALKNAKSRNMPVAIYFASKTEFKFVGESAETIKQCASANGNAVPSTVFDLPSLVARLRAIGVAEVTKMADTKENSEWVSKYGASAHSFVIVSPSGDRLDGGSAIGRRADAFMASAKSAIVAWQSSQAPEGK